MKGTPRQTQSSIDVLAEVLAESFHRSQEVGGAGGSEEVCEAGLDGEDEGSDDGDEGEMGADDGTKKRTEVPFKFTKCKLRNRHFLKEGQGLAMISSLGLEQFLLHTEVPRFNKTYCTDFITSYNHHKGSGIVNGRVVKITAQAIWKLTGLPLGARGIRATIHDVRSEDIPVMDRLIPGLKRTSYGYDLRYLRYKDQTETFVAVASALSEKLVCRTFKLTYIKGAIVLAMETSLRFKLCMQWAEFMAESIRNAIKLTKLRTRNVRFAFGEWLTGLIENVLAEEADGEKGIGLVENEAEQEPDEAADTVGDTGERQLILLPQESPANQEQLVLHRVKKHSRPSTSTHDEEVKRLQQQLADAEKRERWFVAMNLRMSQELDRVKHELSAVRGTTSGLRGEDGKSKAETKNEMQLVVKEGPSSSDAADRSNQLADERQEMERSLCERLEKKNSLHEQELARLKQEVEDQKHVIKLLKKVRAVPWSEDLSPSSFKKEHKRLRREWEKEKEKGYEK